MIVLRAALAWWRSPASKHHLFILRIALESETRIMKLLLASTTGLWKLENSGVGLSGANRSGNPLLLTSLTLGCARVSLVRI